MKIIFFSSEFPPGPGGIGNQAYNLMIQLLTEGHQVTVYTSARPAYSSNAFDVIQDSKIYRYSSGSNFLKRFIHLLEFLIKERKKVDWIILSGLANISLFSLIRILVKARVLCIIHGHEIIMAKGLSRFFVRRTLMRSDKVVSVSQFSKDILKQNGVSRPVFVIPNGVNAPNHRYHKVVKSSGKLVLITLGSVTKRKGQQNVIAALPHLIKKFKSVEYHIVGIPNEQHDVELLARNLGVSQQIVFHGAVNDEMKNALLKQADVFMMLSENLADGDVEGFGIAVLEANGFGLPAIGSRGTGVEQAVDNGVTGYIVDAKNPVEICDCLEAIVDNYATMSKQAYEWAQKHDWRIIGKQYQSVLEESLVVLK